MSPSELLHELGKECKDDEDALQKLKTANGWREFSTEIHDEEEPILYEPGDLVDFETDQLTFDLHHPVELLPQYSYDNSVNLIINDGKNRPRLINSRFSATERNQYQIVDRKGNNDTNIYDQGSQFDLDTSLYKKVIEIPILRFLGLSSGGNMKIGNYHFYFRYADADGNETDFVAESGLVSIFIGNDPYSIRSGFRDENSHKFVRFVLNNIDSAYQYVNVYYTRSTADINENANVLAYRIDQKFIVTNLLTCEFIISGEEHITEVSMDEINPAYQIAESCETQAQCQNMLFLGNIQKAIVPYKELADISLRFCPYICEETYPLEIDQDYSIKSYSQGYYDPSYIYNKVGYWNHELYRFGAVYILSDGTLSPVFNTRGLDKIGIDTTYTDIPFYNTDGSRNYISYEEDTYRIVYYTGDVGNKTQAQGKEFENALGVVSFNISVTQNQQQVYSINFKFPKEVYDYLYNILHIRGMFFVRQKRIPTTLCQAYTVGLDNCSRTPVLPTGENEYTAERFMDDDMILLNDFEPRLYKFTENSYVTPKAAICPEYDVDPGFYNTLFSANQFTITESDLQPINPYLSRYNRNFYLDDTYQISSQSTSIVTILGIEDNMKLGAIGEETFSARAGEAEEGFRYEYLEKENKQTNSTNLVRGSYGPYLGITGYNFAGKLIDIKIPGYDRLTTRDLFIIRYNDKSSYYAISERIAFNDPYYWFNMEDIQNTESTELHLRNPLYRGDCYICRFTHRLNRNFQDPTAPLNDKIVDRNTWKENYEVNDGVLNHEKFNEINLGDINAVKLGMWVTLTVRSTKNLNVRALNESEADETGLTGHPRGFYPHDPIQAQGAYKVPEALCYNKGFEKSLSERYNFEVPDVPAIKNDFTNRIAYSDMHINDAFKNGYRVFKSSHYRDYPKTYGAIIKLVEWKGNLICVFEHGTALIPVNERTVAGQSEGGKVYINTKNVLPENPKILSNTFGSQWRDSVIKTAIAVYGIDTIGKKIWRTDGESFEIISDFAVQKFLNDNISLTERETMPVIGVRNVKTHYNRFKQDVMFTFYDNLYGFEERAWNLCWNEKLQKFITFYSWIPSYSENIYNQYFSFDRNTSKWISKLGISKHDNDFSDGITLDNNIMQDKTWQSDLYLDNRFLPQGDNIKCNITYTLERDNYQNYKYFEITDGKLKLKDTVQFNDLLSEFYERNENKEIVKDDKGRRKWLSNPTNAYRVVIYLNIKADIQVQYENQESTPLQEAYTSGFVNSTFVDYGYYQSVVAVIPKWNMQFLTTDFWKHGQAGIIDIADKIYPTYWYGKQHPFEFEFVVADQITQHKIFDDLEIISNNAEPESFHYEIIGDCFDFAVDKKNMYIRQEATRELYQYNGMDVTFDRSYAELDNIHRLISKSKDKYERSTILPLYYSRQDTINEIEDYYHLKDNVNTKDFSALAGAELIRYPDLDEYRLWNHAKAVDLKSKGRLRGNMHYNEDKWYVQINPINLVQRNETKEDWLNGLVPIELGQSPIPNQIKELGEIEKPDTLSKRNCIFWQWKNSERKEVKLKDKWIKIRIRYTGNKLAIIHSINTLFSISFT